MTVIKEDTKELLLKQRDMAVGLLSTCGYSAHYLAGLMNMTEYQVRNIKNKLAEMEETSSKDRARKDDIKKLQELLKKYPEYVK